jgi:hypothetical protein
MANLAHYGDQWESLDQVLRAMDARYRPIEFPRKPTILHLIRSLRQFAQGQFHFFFQGFRTLDPGVDKWLDERGTEPMFPRLKESPDYSPETVLAATLARVAADVSMIQLAAEQRMWDFNLVGKTSNLAFANRFPNFLERTDYLAADALWLPLKPDGFQVLDDGRRVSKVSIEEEAATENAPAAGSGVSRPSTVLTYLTDTLHVRIVPYARAAVIGIPYGCLGDVQSFLAIPHEVGHYRYWYSRPREIEGVSGRIHANIREEDLGFALPDLKGADRWMEEIFADVYAAIVGGPLAALDAMERAKERPRESFSDFTAEGQHPTPILRPLIYLKTFANYGGYDEKLVLPEHRQKVAEQLLAHWLAMLGPKAAVLAGAENKFISVGTGLALPEKGETPTRPVDFLIHKSLEALKSGRLDDDKTLRTRGWGWSAPTELLRAGKDITAPRSVQEMLKNMASFIENASLLDAPPQLEPVTENEAEQFTVPKIWVDWVFQNKRYLLATETTFAGLGGAEGIDAGELPKDMELKLRPGNKWLPLYGAGGWTTEGPCTTRK